MALVRQRDGHNSVLFRNVKTHKVNIVLILTQVKYSITLLMRGSERPWSRLK